METLGEARAEHKDYMITQVSSQEVKGAAGGTIPLTAPEVFKGGTPTKESDMYSFDLSAQNKESDCDVFTVNQMNLNMHEGSVVETCGDIAVGFVEAGTKIPGELDADMEMEITMYDGSNARTFLSVAIASWLEENTEKLALPRQLEDVRCVVEKSILDIPKAINMSSHFSVEEAVVLLEEVGKCNVVTETLMNSCAGINTPKGENSLFEGLTQLHHRRPIFCSLYRSTNILLH